MDWEVPVQSHATKYDYAYQFQYFVAEQTFNIKDNFMGRLFMLDIWNKATCMQGGSSSS